MAMNATEQLIKGTDSIKLDSDRETALVIKPDDVSLIEKQTEERYTAVPDSITIVNGQQEGWNVNQQKGRT